MCSAIQSMLPQCCLCQRQVTPLCRRCTVHRIALSVCVCVCWIAFFTASCQRPHGQYGSWHSDWWQQHTWWVESRLAPGGGDEGAGEDLRSLGRRTRIRQRESEEGGCSQDMGWERAIGYPGRNGRLTIEQTLDGLIFISG